MRTGARRATWAQRLAARADEWAADQPGRRSLGALQRTLRETTEVLASQLARPGTVAPEWSEAEWAVARAVASIHGVSPLLAVTLPCQGPAAWSAFLAEQTEHTARRFLRIQRLLQLIDERGREAAIAVLPLKGAALHAL